MKKQPPKTFHVTTPVQTFLALRAVRGSVEKFKAVLAAVPKGTPLKGDERVELK